MGWAIFLLLAAATLAALLFVVRPGRGAAQLIAAAVAIAAAGYAWQGQPWLRGKPAPPVGSRTVGETLFARERGRFLEQVGGDAQLLDSADAFIRNGDAAYAIGILRGELSRRPDRAVLWLALGNALSAYAEGTLTPPARYAYTRAIEIAPASPAPRYFFALARAGAGELDAAEAMLQEVARTTPRDASWRPLIREKSIKINELRVIAAQTP